MRPDYLLCAATLLAKRAQTYPLDTMAREVTELAVALQDAYERRTILTDTGDRVVMEQVAREIDALIRELRELDWRVEMGAKHWKCYAPDGVGFTILPQTPSDWRSLRNTRSELRRLGAPV